MILSKRERYIAILVGAVLGAWALDHYALTPLIERKQRIRADIDAVTVEHEVADTLLNNTTRVHSIWNSMLAGGLQPDASASESQVLNAIAEWARAANLTVSSLKPERVEKLKQFQQITFRATATGSMNSISRFLFNIQRAKMPIRITDIQLSSRKEGIDDLSLQLGISTIFLLPEKPDASGASTARPPRPSTGAAPAKEEVER